MAKTQLVIWKFLMEIGLDFHQLLLRWLLGDDYDCDFNSYPIHPTQKPLPATWIWLPGKEIMDLDLEYKTRIFFTC